MKTVKITSVIATLSLVFLMSLASFANSGIIYSGDLTKSGDKSSAFEKDYSYLRFDVDNYINASESEPIVLPVANEFEYLRFDVNNFANNNTESITELPVNEFDYLRFDAKAYAAAAIATPEALPVTE